MAKRIGILGGMSPESTSEYYQYITRNYTKQFGNHNYPEIIIYSVSFQPYIDWPMQNDWDSVAKGLSEAARKLEAAGADFIIIATNTMHIVVDEIRAKINIPVLSLLDTVGEEILKRDLRKVALLGTRFTMEKTFYQDALRNKGIEVIVPDAGDRDVVNQVIYDELVAGIITEESRQKYVEIIHKLKLKGAEGVILGCTEIPLLISETDVGLPVFDTTFLHAEAALAFALD
ncbi:MAG: aspartate/glutamate racemase family protein [Anaerolineaceae bacterium]|nr:aspartate/glutamate racemase family protein [Anaerolineaceae bacterium]